MANYEPPNQRGRQLSRTGDSLYELLGLPKTANLDEIKKTYRKKALACHPDKNQGNEEATELFKRINHANSVLTDPTKRKIYDATGSMGLQIASQVGEERFASCLCLHTCWGKALCCFAFLFTGCCCCFCCCACCNCCCGRCGPKPSEYDEEYDDMENLEAQEKGSDEPITTQPTGSAMPAAAAPSGDTFRDDREKLVDVDPTTPIVLGPPPGQYGAAE